MNGAPATRVLFLETPDAHLTHRHSTQALETTGTVGGTSNEQRATSDEQPLILSLREAWDSVGFLCTCISNGILRITNQFPLCVSVPVAKKGTCCCFKRPILPFSRWLDQMETWWGLTASRAWHLVQHQSLLFLFPIWTLPCSCQREGVKMIGFTMNPDMTA